jgi:hypothetical protein
MTQSACQPTGKSIFRMTRGDTRTFTLTVVLAGQRVNLTGCKLAWVANSYHPDDNSRITHSTDDGGVVISSGQSPASPTTGQATLALHPPDTNQFANEWIRFKTNWVLTDPSGNVTTIDRNEEIHMAPNV